MYRMYAVRMRVSRIVVEILKREMVFGEQEKAMNLEATWWRKNGEAGK
jgi:hypothetical protein